MGKGTLIGSGVAAAICVFGAWYGFSKVSSIPSIHGSELLTGTGDMLYCYAEPADCVKGITITSTKSLSELLDYAESAMVLETEVNPAYHEQFSAALEKIMDAKESSAEITSPVIYSSVLSSISQDMKDLVKLDDGQDAFSICAALGVVFGLFAVPWFGYEVYEAIGEAAESHRRAEARRRDDHFRNHDDNDLRR